jgi:hypothetical protein
MPSNHVPRELSAIKATAFGSSLFMSVVSQGLVSLYIWSGLCVGPFSLPLSPSPRWGHLRCFVSVHSPINGKLPFDSKKDKEVNI